MKKRQKNLLTILFTFILMLGLSVCVWAASGTVKSVKVTNPKGGKVTLQPKQSLTLKVKVTTKGSVSEKVGYKTSKKKVATVSSKGKIVAKKEGTSKITVYAKANPKKKAVVTVTVKKVTATSEDKIETVTVPKKGSSVTLSFKPKKSGTYYLHTMNIFNNGVVNVTNASGKKIGSGGLSDIKDVDFKVAAGQTYYIIIEGKEKAAKKFSYIINQETNLPDGTLEEGKTTAVTLKGYENSRLGDYIYYLEFTPKKTARYYFHNNGDITMDAISADGKKHIEFASTSSRQLVDERGRDYAYDLMAGVKYFICVMKTASDGSSIDMSYKSDYTFNMLVNTDLYMIEDKSHEFLQENTHYALTVPPRKEYYYKFVAPRDGIYFVTRKDGVFEAYETSFIYDANGEHIQRNRNLAEDGDIPTTSEEGTIVKKGQVYWIRVGNRSNESATTYNICISQDRFYMSGSAVNELAVYSADALKDKDVAYYKLDLTNRYGTTRVRIPYVGNHVIIYPSLGTIGKYEYPDLEPEEDEIPSGYDSVVTVDAQPGIYYICAYSDGYFKTEKFIVKLSGK